MNSQQNLKERSEANFPFLQPRAPRMRLDGEAKERLIRWIQRRMDEFGIEVSDLGEIETQAVLASSPARIMYRDAQGNGWDGSGEVPEWLQRYVNAGQAMDHFRVSPGETTE